MKNTILFVVLWVILIVVFAGVMLFAVNATTDAIGAEPTATPPFTQTMTFLPYAAKPYATATPPIPEGYWNGEE